MPVKPDLLARGPELLARGPWRRQDLAVVWRSDPFEPGAHASAQADGMLAALRERGSPSYDGLAARLVSFEARDRSLKLELQPVRWALRLLADGGHSSISAMCVVRDAEGRWLAGRRSAWVASWAGLWELGASGAVEVGENPAQALERELREEWSLRAQRSDLEALVKLPGGHVLLVGQAWLGAGARAAPNDEHDAFAWWPAAVERWPPEAGAEVRQMGAMLNGT